MQSFNPPAPLLQATLDHRNLYVYQFYTAFYSLQRFRRFVKIFREILFSVALHLVQSTPTQENQNHRETLESLYN